MFQETASIGAHEETHAAELTSDDLVLSLAIDDAELIEALSAYPAGRRRDAFALQALRIGVLALRQASGQVDVERVKNQGDRLIGDLEGALSKYREGVAGDIGKALQEYFDPKNGRFSERVERLVAQDGDLERALRTQISGDGSVLAKTLSSHIGPDSPIMRAIDPTSEKGLAKSLSSAVEGATAREREVILREFSLDNTDGALSRLVRELTEKHGAAGAALELKVAEAVAEFSLDKEDSALSRLVRRVDAAQQTMSNELSLDRDGSALGRIRKELLTHIEGLSTRHQAFQRDVLERLTEMAARKAEALRSTSHGVDFEAALNDIVADIAQRAGDVATPTGATTGMIKHCKTGDCVVELGPEHAAAGAKLVIEAKQSASYTLGKARAEIAEARRNRGAEVGLFVFSSRSAPAGLDPFLRLGEDIFVIWDENDAATDVYVRAGLSVAKALLTTSASNEKRAALDLETMERAVRSIEKQLKGLSEVDGWAKNVVRDGGKIGERVRRMTAALEHDIGNLDDGLRDLRESA